MKCVCGYEHKEGIDDQGKWNDKLIGDEKFHSITGVILRIKEECFYDDPRDVSLYACPKCGTVRIGE